MPFQVTTQPFFGVNDTAALPDSRDPLPEYVLINTNTGESASIIPGFGGILRKLVLHHKGAEQLADGKTSGLFSVVEAPESPQALIAGETYASAILYPFASRIQHGVYAFEGVQYALPMNESQRNNAIHGLVYDQPFTVIDEEANDQEARLTLRYTHTGDFNGYPFPFELTITYTLAADGLTLTYSALNNGSAPSPSSFGWHPYFTLKPFPPATETGATESDTILDDMTLALPVQSVIVLDNDMMPTGTRNPLATNTFTLKKWQVDAPFIVNAVDAGCVETHLHAPKNGVTLVVSQETGPGKLNYLIVFTPAKRDSIAIEPQTANVNAFNNSEGLSVVEPGDALDGWIRVALR
ncbi:MAG: aldose 1-epimerase [Bacteroidetes bacterium]|nr:aldose 1-epimerase [Fibrella sp.]